MKLAHVYQLYEMTGEDRRRHEVAKQSWCAYLTDSVVDCPYVVSPTSRTADKLVGDQRNVPYVNDIIDYGFEDPTVDAVVFTNSDIGFIASPVEYLTKELQTYGCSWLRRLDYHRLTSPPNSANGGVIGGGADLFAMTRMWWQSQRKKFPLMFIGTEGFDFVFLASMHAAGATMHNQPCLIFHERHGSFWKKDKTTLTKSPAQAYNRKVCTTWAWANGYGYMLNKSKNSFLFRELKFLAPVTRKDFDLGIAVLGRYGDIINVLPIAKKYADFGQRIAWGVLPEYADIFDGVSYVTPIVVNTKLQNVNVCVRELNKCCTNVQAWQMFGNSAVGRRRTSSFAMEMWRMAGAEAEFMNLPLIFDRREPAREAELVKRVIGENQRPLLYSGTGNSSPFDKTHICLQAVKKVAAQYNCPVIDISQARAQRIYDMLGVFEASRGLVVIDSAYLHLTYACGTPTFALTSEGPKNDRSPWYGSQPRAQWRAKASYSNWQDIILELERWFIETQQPAQELTVVEAT